MNIYGIMILSSFIIGFLFIFINLSIHGIPKNIILYQIMLSAICTIYFSKYVTILTSGDLTINFLNAGLSSLGGAGGLLISVVIFTKIYTDNKKLFYETFALALPIMYGVSKLGCHFAGCCYGIPYDGVLSTVSKYHSNACELFPVQLSESIIFIVLFLISILLYYKKININYLAFEVIVCAVAKFMLDYLRYSNLGKLITFNQIICIIFCIIGIIILARDIHRKRGQKHGKKQV